MISRGRCFPLSLARGLVVLVFLSPLSLAFAAEGPVLSGRACALRLDHSGLLFPTDHIPDVWRCQMAEVIQHPTTTSLTGPLDIPISRDLYAYLLDHLTLTAALVRELGLGQYRVELRGDHRVWLDDGEGTSGELQLVRQDDGTRLYLIDGEHHSRLFPVIKGKAVVLMATKVTGGGQSGPTVETTIVTYTQLNNAFLAGVVRLLQSFIGETVTRKITKAFSVTNQLAAVAAEDPQNIVALAQRQTVVTQGEVATFAALVGQLHSPSRERATLRTLP